jgi:hypothetical protein
MKFLFAGDSWASKAWTEENHLLPSAPTDIRLATHWPWEYELCQTPGQGNLDLLSRILKLNLPSTTPIVWVYTEPGRDYGHITGKDPFDWMRDENIFELRKELDAHILKTMRKQLPNPIGLIGGLSDINTELAESLGFTVLHPSWQQWIAQKLESKWFQHGWGASDIGWRAVHHNVTPSRAATFAWDEQIKEWCWWEEQGYFCHEHPSPQANLEFAEYLQPRVQEWLKQYEK